MYHHQSDDGLGNPKTHFLLFLLKKKYFSLHGARLNTAFTAIVYVLSMAFAFFYQHFVK